MSHYSTTLRPTSEVITVFVRVWKKWGVPNEEIDVNLDAIGLFGPSPAPVHGPGPVYGGPGYGPQHPSPGIGGPVVSPPGYAPAQPEPATQVCGGPNLVHNGDFESGFGPMGQGEVGRGWTAFTNGGAIHAGFRAEDWSQVISDGAYGQAIELSSRGLYPTDADRYAGIAQRIGGLRPGATYELTLRGLVRGTAGSHDAYRFEGQWGFTEGYQDDWRHVKNWERLDLGPIYPLDQPVSMGLYRVRFTAPAASIVLFVRGWKKWAVTNEEMILNVDGISLHACGGVGGPVHPIHPPVAPPIYPGPSAPHPIVPSKPVPVHPEHPAVCTYTVRAGDTLAAIALRVHVSTQDLVRVNRIQNPNLIYVGQVLTLPSCGPVLQPPMGPGPQPGDGHKPQQPGKPEQPGTGVRTYTVRAGDTLSGIAVRFGVSQQQLATVNGIRNPNHIYIGQVLRIP
jgi:LysM repeat protein